MKSMELNYRKKKKYEIDDQIPKKCNIQEPRFSCKTKAFYSWKLKRLNAEKKRTKDEKNQ